MKENRLWYTAPAKQWAEALPLGNGRIGMMIYGGVSEEHIQLNEETVWSGWDCTEFENPDNLLYLEETRRLIFEGKYSEASALCNQHHVCRGKGHNDPYGFGSYQTAGDLFISIPQDACKDYYRDLRLNEGMATVACDSVRREYFVSPTYNTAVMRISGVTEGITLRYEREEATIITDDKEIMAIGHLPTKFVVLIRKEIQDESTIIYITASTNYKTDRDPIATCRETLDSAMAAGYEKLARDTKDCFSELMGRAEISLTESEERKMLPTDKRLADPEEDTGLIELYFNYGKYLLIGSSFRARLPANLQGIWCEDYHAPWAADYHLDINVQMNYWMAEVCNLPELITPFFELIKLMSQHGRETARISYNCPGWVAHVVTNPWGYTALGQAPIFGAFATGGAWCLRYIKERWLYGGDREFLKEMYPIIKGASEFFCSYLIMDPRSGYLATVPATSPENCFFDPSTGKIAFISAGPTMDMSIIRELFEFNVEVASILEIDHDFVRELETKISKLPPLRIGKHGQIMEWSEDFDEPDPGHRHMSHLYALYPASAINQSTPELYEAAKKSVRRRVSCGGGHTGWSRAWLVNFYARFMDGNSAREHIVKLFQENTFHNLFDSCIYRINPRKDVFQIDGNLGTPAGIAEMLIQSHGGYIELLPALPDAWSKGEFKGLMARGGYRVDAKWENKRIVYCNIIGHTEDTFKVKFNGQIVEATGKYCYELD